MKKSLIGTLSVFAAFSGLAAVETRDWRLPLMTKPPVIDGVVDETEWQGAHSSFGFLRYGGAGDTVVPVKTRFWMGRTADRLFLAGLSEIGPAGLKKNVKPRRGNVEIGGEDSYEMVFSPDLSPKVPDIRWIVINYNGAYRTQALVGNNMAAWIPETLEMKSSETGGKWHFEWSVKLSEIGFDKPGVERHGIRLCRNVKSIENQWGFQSSVQPNEHGFFTSANMVESVFDNTAIAVQLIEEDRDSATSWRLKLRLHNPTAKAVKVEAKVEGRPVNSQPGILLKSLDLKAGETVEFPVSGPMLGDENIVMTADVKQDGKGVFFRQFNWRPNGPAPRWLKAGDDGSGAQYKFAFYPSYNKMRLKADLSTIAKGRPAVVKVELRSDVNRGKDVLAATELKLDAEGNADVIWECPDLKAETQRTGVGGYTITFEAKGVKNGKKVIPFRRDVFAWEGFKGGTSDTIPSMFTPIEDFKDGFLGLFGDRHVKTILRDHTIGDFELWSQVLAAGKPLLARPMRLIGADAARVSARAIWDVDGLMDWHLTLQPGHHEPITLEIALNAERAKLLHPCADGMRFNYAGFVPAGKGRVWDSSKAPRTSIIGDYLPYVWVGGPLRGLAVFGENDRGWVIDDKMHCQEIIREDDGTVVLKLNLVQKPVDLAAAQEIHLGFMATPVKPMEKNWRSSPIGGLIGSCYYWGGFTASDEIHPYDGTDTFWKKMAEARRTGKVDTAYVERAIAERVFHCPTNSPNFNNVVRCFRAHFYSGMNSMASSCGNDAAKYVWYTNGRGVRMGNPEGSTFGDEWTVEAFSKDRPFEWDHCKSYSLDPNKAYLDFAAYWWEKALGYGVCDYYYWDDIFCQSNFDLVGTESYRTANGDIQPACGIFNQRAQVKRCAVLQAEHGWIDHKNWVHMTNTALAPVCAFAGMNYDWEDVAGDTAIQERYPREAIQAQSLGRQFGNQVAVMGYFATKDPKSEKLKWLERTGTGACLTHELRWTRVKVWNDAHDKLVAWGYRLPTTRVWNYWDEDVKFPVEITGGEQAALAMAKDGGEAVIVISDWDKGGDYAVKPCVKTLNLKENFTAYDLETGKSLPVENGVIRVKLDRLNFVMIGIK